MSDHPREGFSYPFIEKIEIFDCGFRIGALLRESDGTLRAARWRLEDIADHAEWSVTSNITA